MQSLRKLGTAILIAGALALPTLASADSPPTDKPQKAEKKHKDSDKSSKKDKDAKHEKGSSQDKTMH